MWISLMFVHYSILEPPAVVQSKAPAQARGTVPEVMVILIMTHLPPPKQARLSTGYGLYSATCPFQQPLQVGGGFLRLLLQTEPDQRQNR
jgi:hypothetical protein